MLHIRVTGGYTGKAKSCEEAWVPTVSIHRPLTTPFLTVISDRILAQ